MKHSSLVKLVVCCALVVCWAFGLSQSSTYGQGRSLTAEQLEAIVNPSLAQCSPPSDQTKSGQIDPATIIPTRNAREFPKDRIAKTLHGVWRGQVYGDYNKDLRVDYFWIIDAQRNEGLIIAQRTGNESTAGLQPVANAPKITYLMCAHEGYIPSSEAGAQIHQFVKVSHSIEDAQQILQNATGRELSKGTITDLWQEIVASGYFTSLPAIAFAGALFKPIQLELIASEIGPSQVSMKWNAEYYGGGATQLKFTSGVPMRGVEYTQFIGTTATSGDYLVASPGNGKLYKVEASTVSAATEQCEEDSEREECYPEYYDVAFDSVTVGPLEEEGKESAGGVGNKQNDVAVRAGKKRNDVASGTSKKRKSRFR